MRINPISQNYGRKSNIQHQTKTCTPVSQEVAFEGKKVATNPSLLKKIGCYTLAILATPFIIIGFLGDMLTECVTGETLSNNEK